jgi:spore coat polysaccharide biosynthesis predicted glycosyltransferase SpsG/CMP-N-acetylneuraminic acid synthetase
MIYYAINACLGHQGLHRVVVSTDDEEIALLSERFGAEVLYRPPHLAEDAVPLDPVIAHAVDAAEEKDGESFDIVLTVQPTSPLVRPADIAQAIDCFRNSPDLDTVLSVTEDRHLTWTVCEGKAVPEYRARVNRQLLPPRFRETGAIIACRRAQLRLGTRIGTNIELLELPQSRSIDIDSIADLQLCESLLSRRRVVFTVVGYPAVGLGHAYRALMLAHELVQLDISFVCERRSEIAANLIREKNYSVHVCENGELLKAVLDLEPDLVINDILDTDSAYVSGLRQYGCRVINFEDLGPGGDQAHLVVNALYDESNLQTHLVGARYFCLRDEFLFAPVQKKNDVVKRVLITFGGVDENNLTTRVFRLIVSLCKRNEVEINIVVGPGYAHHAALKSTVEQAAYSKVVITAATSRISALMAQADLAITSGGRTVFELASLQIPIMVICQNPRELTHRFASWDNGVLNLGLHDQVSDAQIIDKFETLRSDLTLRQEMCLRAASCDLTSGKRRVIAAILAVLNGGIVEK